MSPLSVESMTELVAPLGEPHRSKVRDYIRKLENRLALAESALEAARAEEVRVLREALTRLLSRAEGVYAQMYYSEPWGHRNDDAFNLARAALEQTK